MDTAIIIKLLVTFVLSFIFGYERQKSNKHVGFGTFIFVAIGACVLSIIALDFDPGNPISLIGAIITGIGFLGAGALIRGGDKVFGFTSAATIWAFAVFGVAIGVGEYSLGILLYSFIWIIVFFDKYLEREGIGSYRTKLVIKTKGYIEENKVRDFLVSMGIKKTKLVGADFDKEDNQMSFTYFVEGESSKIKKMPKGVFSKSWVKSLKLE